MLEHDGCYKLLKNVCTICTLFMWVASSESDMLYVSHWFTMPQFNIHERTYLTEHYHRSYAFGRNNGPSTKYVFFEFTRAINKTPPTKRNFTKLINKFKTTGSATNQNKENSGRPRNARQNDNCGIVLDKLHVLQRRALAVYHKNSIYHGQWYKG